MQKILRIILSSIFVLTLFIITSKTSFAVSIDINPEFVNTQTKTVTVTISGLEPGKKYTFCPISSASPTNCPGFDSQFNNPYEFTAKESTKQFVICGDGKNVKIFCTDKDSFKPGTYTLRVFDEKHSVATIAFQATTPSGGGPAGDGSNPGGQNPCPDGICKTALGDIPTNPQAFGTKILNIGIGLGGGFAFILMVIGSIRVLTSSGDQQKLSGGRDMIVAAIAGLLFIVFSTLILRFIGISILGI